MLRYTEPKLLVIPQSAIDAGLKQAQRERSEVFYQVARALRQAIGRLRGRIEQAAKPLHTSLTQH